MELEEALVAAGAERVNVPSLLAPEVQSNEKIAFGTDEPGRRQRERCAPRRGLATRMPFLSDTPSAVLPGPALACRSPRLWASLRHLRGYVAEYRSSASAPAGVSDSRKTTEPTLPPRRSHRRQAGAYRNARRHGLVLAALLDAWLPRAVEDGLSATAGHPRLWGRRRRRQREPGSLRGDAAGYIRRPRRPRPGTTKDPLGNRGVGDLTTNTTHTTPLARMAPPRSLLVPPWAEGLEVAPDGLVL